MPRYVISCDVAQSSDVVLVNDAVHCTSGSVQVTEYQPTLGDLTEQEIFELFGATLLLFAVAFIFRFVVDQILNRR